MNSSTKVSRIGNFVHSWESNISGQLLISRTWRPLSLESRISTPPMVIFSSTDKQAFTAKLKYDSFYGESILDTILKSLL